MRILLDLLMVYVFYQGLFFGEKDRTAMRDALKITLRSGLMLILILSTALLIFPSFFSELLGMVDGDIRK